MKKALFSMALLTTFSDINGFAGVVVTFSQDGNGVLASWAGNIDPGVGASYSHYTTVGNEFAVVWVDRFMVDRQPGDYHVWVGGTWQDSGLNFKYRSFNEGTGTWGYLMDAFFFPSEGLVNDPGVVDFGDGSMYFVRFDDVTISELGADLFDNTLIWTSSEGGENTVVYTTQGGISHETFTNTFGAAASQTRVVNALPSTIINGSHHRLLLEQKELNKDNAFWALGDFSDHRRDDAWIGTSEVGMAHDFVAGLRGGLGVGAGYLDQNMPYGGTQELDGQYLMAELDYLIPDTSVVFSVTGVLGDWESDISRGYLFGGNPQLSHGVADVESSSVRFRADWLDLFNIWGVSITPRAAYTISRIDRNAYSEFGGSMPVAFDGDQHTTMELRVGLSAEKELTDRLTVRGILEGVRRDDKRAGSFSGQMFGFFNFSIPGEQVDQNWMRTGVELGYQIEESTTITGTAFGATEGEDPQLTLALGLNVGF